MKIINFTTKNFSLDYQNSNYARAYHDAQEHLGFAYSNESNGINYSMFKNGWNIYVFNLTNSQQDSEGFELVKDGATTVQIRFSSPVPAGGITMIAYSESDGLILIDSIYKFILMILIFFKNLGNRTITSDLTV